MKTAEVLTIPEQLKPSIELLDGIIIDTLGRNQIGSEHQTGWLVPTNVIGHSFPDSAPHTKIQVDGTSWKLTIVQRKVDHDFAWHTGTSVSVYQRSKDGLSLDQYTFSSGLLKPSVNIYRGKDRKDIFLNEVFGHLTAGNLVAKDEALHGYAAEIANRPGRMTERDRRAYQKGSFLMRLWERTYTGMEIDLSK